MRLAVILVIVAVSERLWFDLGPNVELVTLACVVAGMYLPWKWRMAVPMTIMVMSDGVLGIGAISLFTWSGFAAMGLMASVGKRFEDKVVGGLVAGIVGVMWFFSWTNYGVWLTESYGMYTNDWRGLWDCYVAGLPFLRLQLMSMLVSVPVGVLVVESVRSWKGNQGVGGAYV